MSGKHLDETRSNRRVDLVFGLLALMGIVALTVLALWVQGLSRDLRISNDARDALSRQVQQLGEKPVAGPPGSRGEPGQSITGPKGDTGPTGPPGPAGPTGERGIRGLQGIKGDTGSQGDAVAGSPGTNGSDGVQGPAGPAGPAGPQGDPGPAGPEGPAGADGRDGQDGKDGQSCPDGYSWQAPSYDPDALVCRKDGAPDPSPTAATPMAAGLDPNRRMYV
jgi:hypothetical protein